MHTLFSPVAHIDVLQAMSRSGNDLNLTATVVLTAWGDTSWRPGGHALRIA
jgi:hypothetical protein